MAHFVQLATFNNAVTSMPIIFDLNNKNLLTWEHTTTKPYKCQVPAM